ncbi:MAG: hypothetical protein GX471_13615 [Candidatus Microthrix parvicella]|jgi:hypothetical protein|uniref:Uncharacterized protein n=1 Tax=Candidatus Neomicrothrix parvicella RN1 TaxID=1229780 RepID=R4Z6J4_9ACTN|nr:hypothetical protein [Candidatus Microthrix parvicella]MBP7597031.1 hypothetical protein [Candidatus Microthrix sp.]NLH67184.1 hypothetical protein [Candidatus Microthrix parvicella]CCM64602.1 exported hypothetical protein [Candidatus Microthrix parvicella RN1]
MTDPGNPTAQQRRLAELQARRPKAKRRHPARASRIAVLGLSTTAMFGIVAKLGVDANSQTVATTGTPSAQAATVPAGNAAATLTDRSAEAAIDAELANATVVTAPPIRVTVPPAGDAGTLSPSSSSSAYDPSSYRPTPVGAAMPRPAPAPVRTSGSN